MRDFLPVAMQILELDTLPRIVPVDQLPSDGQPSFGQFDFVDVVIYVAVANRHIVDILRSTAHELVHYRQNLDEPLSAEQGSTGSEIENQANLVAGVIMRRFGKLYPHYFECGPVVLGEARRKKPRTRRGKNPRYVYGAWGPWGVNTGGEISGDGGGDVSESRFKPPNYGIYRFTPTGQAFNPFSENVKDQIILNSSGFVNENNFDKLMNVYLDDLYGATPQQIVDDLIQQTEYNSQYGIPDAEGDDVYLAFARVMSDLLKPMRPQRSVDESKKDACYRKVKAAYKVWPSAYASGALVQCRKKGAKNWGKKKKK
jgi:hypothetical protein